MNGQLSGSFINNPQKQGHRKEENPLQDNWNSPGITPNMTRKATIDPIDEKHTEVGNRELHANICQMINVGLESPVV
jgi:hypothetical protein